MKGILLHVSYRGEQARAFADEMQQSGLRAAVLAEAGGMQYDHYVPPAATHCVLPLAETNCVLLIEHWRDQAALDAHSAGEPMAQLKALKAKYGLETGIERFE